MIGSFNPGLIPHHDVRNEGYSAMRALGEDMAKPFTPVKKHWTPGMTAAERDQGPTPRCTAFGPLTAISCTPIPHKGLNPVIPFQQMYDENQAFDQANGRVFTEGATTIAAMETLKAHGIIRSYTWGWTMEELFRALAKKAVVTGTIITRSMFFPDAEGIVRVDYNMGVAGGHEYCLNGYDPARDLLSTPGTWGETKPGDNGMMYIPGEDFYKLLRDDGEFTVMMEVR